MKEREFFELQSFTKEPGVEEWRAVFEAKAMFLERHTIAVSVPAFEDGEDGERKPRTSDDCLLRAKRRAALGLRLMADFALAQMPKDEQDFILKALQSIREKEGDPADGDLPGEPPTAAG